MVRMLRGMSALWGKRIVNAAAVVPVLCLLAAGLAGCEYADDVGPSPSGAAGRTGNSIATDTVPMASVDPELGRRALTPEGSRAALSAYRIRAVRQSLV
jgi:hypothetical protein